MRGWLRFFFGAEATLKRETIVLCWLLVTFMVVMTFGFAPPEHAKDYGTILQSALWPLVALIAAIFGIQIPQILQTGTLNIEKQEEPVPAPEALQPEKKGEPE